MKAPSTWIDNLKLISTTAIIILHVAADGVVAEFNKNGNHTWWIAHFYDSLCRFGTPAFIMITGCLLLRQSIGMRDFLKRRLNRILLPFVFWFSVYLAFHFALKVRDEGLESQAAHFFPWFFEQLLQGSEVHLWYVYMIIGVYMFIPIIKPWAQTASKAGLIYFLVIWLFTLLINQQRVVEWKTPFDLSYFSGYIGYVVLGYFIAEKITITQRMRYLAVPVFLTGFLITLYGTYFLTASDGTFSDIFYNRLSINVLLMAVSAFIFIKGMGEQKTENTFATVRTTVGKYGFGIYLNHVIILIVLSHFGINYKLINPWVGIPLTAIICLFLSCLVINILNRMPLGKHVSGSL